MKQYLFDTNTVMYLSDKKSSNYTVVRRRFENTDAKDQFFISVLSFYELRYGCFR